jgi:hypothetical protein
MCVDLVLFMPDSSSDFCIDRIILVFPRFRLQKDMRGVAEGGSPSEAGANIQRHAHTTDVLYVCLSTYAGAE